MIHHYFQKTKMHCSQNNISSEKKQQKWTENFVWRRISDVFTDYEVIGPNIGIKDIKQGSLGDCYLLSGLASIVTNAKDQLYKVFMTDIDLPILPNQTIYALRLLVNGKYEVIVIDDYIPYNEKMQKPAF